MSLQSADRVFDGADSESDLVGSTGEGVAETQSVRLVSDASSGFGAIGVVVCADVLALVISVSIVRLALGPLSPLGTILAFVGVQTFILGLALLGLYPGRGVWGPDRIRLRGLMVLISFVSPAIAGALLQMQGVDVGARECLFIGILLFFFSSLLELIAIHFADAQGWWRSRAVFVGDPSIKSRIERDLRIYPELGWELVPSNYASATQIDSARAAPMSGIGTFICDTLSMAPKYRPATRQVLSGRSSGTAALGKLVKRTIDLTGAVMLAIFVLPILGTVALAIYLADGKPIFFRQPRDGLGGREVKVLKFRSMYRDAQEKLATLLAEDPGARAEWEKHCKLSRDPRILPTIGCLIRRTSIDELPQLWNVIKGEMSLVGPRPFPENHLAMFSSEFRKIRCSVVPGLSGLWQVTLRSNAEISDQEQLDRAYIEAWSLWLDIYILLRTPIALFSAKGAR